MKEVKGEIKVPVSKERAKEYFVVSNQALENDKRCKVTVFTDEPNHYAFSISVKTGGGRTINNTYDIVFVQEDMTSTIIQLTVGSDASAKISLNALMKQIQKELK